MYPIPVSTVCILSPAKINLFLAITGRREDGFHNLLSLAAPLAWGDTLHASAAEEFSLECDDPTLTLDTDNLVLKAAEAFRASTGWKGGADFRLEKNIPVGAGLGGGSSNAVATLKALNQLSGGRMSLSALSEVAATLGADCPLFVDSAPVIMRGRGDILEKLTDSECDRLRNQRVLIFKPGFGVSTPWAYKKMVENPQFYTSSATAESRLEQWRNDNDAKLESLYLNDMQAVVYAKYPALPTLHNILRQRFGLSARMSGSGSASFALLGEDTPSEPIESCIREAWGQTAVILKPRLA